MNLCLTYCTQKDWVNIYSLDTCEGMVAMVEQLCNQAYASKLHDLQTLFIYTQTNPLTSEVAYKWCPCQPWSLLSCY